MTEAPKPAKRKRVFNVHPRLGNGHTAAGTPRRTAKEDAAALDAALAKGKRLRPPGVIHGMGRTWGKP